MDDIRPEDLPGHAAASQGVAQPRQRRRSGLRPVGPESEDRGGSEAPEETLTETGDED
jgi:hypothetical protein